MVPCFLTDFPGFWTYIWASLTYLNINSNTLKLDYNKNEINNQHNIHMKCTAYT